MKSCLVLALLFTTLHSAAVMLTLCQPVQAQLDLEREIELIFLYQPGEGERYDKKAELEKLGHRQEVHTKLLNMIAKYRYSARGTKEYLYFGGSTWMAGEFQLKEGVALLSNIAVDQKIAPSIRAYAVRSLGQIDAESNKQLLLKLLTNRSNYYLVRIFAADALAKTKDPKVLRILERCISEERDSHVREKFSRAAQELKGNLKSQR